jgi:hypothetical protein
VVRLLTVLLGFNRDVVLPPTRRSRGCR